MLGVHQNFAGFVIIAIMIGTGIAMAEPTLTVWHNESMGNIEIHARLTGINTTPQVMYAGCSPNSGAGHGKAMDRAGEGEWIKTISHIGFATTYLVYAHREDGPTLASNLIVVYNREPSDQIKVNLTHESLNLSLPTFGVIVAEAYSPNGILDVRIRRVMFSTRQPYREHDILHGVGYGGGDMSCTIENSTYRHPNPDYVARLDRNTTDAICLYAIYVFDRKYNYTVKTGNITIGKPYVVINGLRICESLLILAVIPCLYLLGGSCSRHGWRCSTAA